MTETIDMTVVQELLDICDDGDTSLLTELIEMFLDDGPARVTAILDAIQAGDLEAVERGAHALKGSSGNLGAMLLMTTAEDLQVASGGGESERVRALGPQLEAHYATAADALRNLHAKLSR